MRIDLEVQEEWKNFDLSSNSARFVVSSLNYEFFLICIDLNIYLVSHFSVCTHFSFRFLIISTSLMVSSICQAYVICIGCNGFARLILLFSRFCLSVLSLGLNYCVVVS